MPNLPSASRVARRFLAAEITPERAKQIREKLVTFFHLPEKEVAEVPDHLLGDIRLVRDWWLLWPEARKLISDGVISYGLYKALENHYGQDLETRRLLDNATVRKLIKLQGQLPKYFRPPRTATAWRGTAMSHQNLARILGHPPKVHGKKWTVEEVTAQVSAAKHRSWTLLKSTGKHFSYKATLRELGKLRDVSGTYIVLMKADDTSQFLFNPRGMMDLMGGTVNQHMIAEEREVVPMRSKIRINEIGYKTVLLAQMGKRAKDACP